MTEQAWVLRTKGSQYYAGCGRPEGQRLIDDLCGAFRAGSSTHAQRVAQNARRAFYTPYLYVIPIERETVRKVEEIEGLVDLYVLQLPSKAFVKEWGNNSCGCAIGDAQRFTPRDLALKTYDPTISYEFIPVRVTEILGDWKECDND